MSFQDHSVQSDLMPLQLLQQLKNLEHKKKREILVIFQKEPSDFSQQAGVLLLQQLLPPSAAVHYVTLDQLPTALTSQSSWGLIILGVGSTLFAEEDITSELLSMLDCDVQKIGLFGIAPKQQFFSFTLHSADLDKKFHFYFFSFIIPANVSQETGFGIKCK